MSGLNRINLLVWDLDHEGASGALWWVLSINRKLDLWSSAGDRESARFVTMCCIAERGVKISRAVTVDGLAQIVRQAHAEAAREGRATVAVDCKHVGPEGRAAIDRACNDWAEVEVARRVADGEHPLKVLAKAMGL